MLRGLAARALETIRGFSFAFAVMLSSVLTAGCGMLIIWAGEVTLGYIVLWISYVSILIIATICLFVTEAALRQLKPSNLDDENKYTSTNSLMTADLEFKFEEQT